MFRCCIKLSSSMFVLILQVPSFILVGPNIFLNIPGGPEQSYLNWSNMPWNICRSSCRDFSESFR